MFFTNNFFLHLELIDSIFYNIIEKIYLRKNGAEVNNSPENNTNSQNQQNTQYRASRTGTAHRLEQTSSQTVQRPSQISGQTRRPLNDEERRRLEAARQAAMKSGVVRDDEVRRRRADVQYLNGSQAQSGGPRASQTRSAQQNAQMHQQTRRRKKKIRINAGAVAFVVLIVLLIGVSANQISKNTNFYLGVGKETEKTDSIESGNLSEENNELENILNNQENENDVNLILYDTIVVDNSTIDEGDLILVNYEHEYKKVDSVTLKNAYNEKTGKLKVSSTTISMVPEAFDALEEMVIALEEDTGCDDLLLNSGYRNTESQTYIYNTNVAENGEEYAQAYVAQPGYSEHHTGLACDLTFYTDDGQIISIADHEYGYWLGVNCIENGFVRRYPSDKVDITKIAYEAWHFRYVGVPHAYAMTEFDYCLEEYIDAVKAYTSDTTMLYVKKNARVDEVTVDSLPTEGGWLVYFVPASDGETTDIKLPRGEKYTNYEISGNNVDGFIVTITLE